MMNDDNFESNNLDESFDVDNSSDLEFSDVQTQPRTNDNNLKSLIRKKVENKVGEQISNTFSWKTKLIIIGVVFSFFLVFLLIFSATLDLDEDNDTVCVNLPAIDNVCKSITPSGYATMSVDEYVAGVVAAEVGGMVDDNLNTYKALAVAARSYALAGATKNNGNCTVVAGPTFQAYKSNPDGNAIKAAEDTSGMVLTLNDSIYSSEYDALCIKSEDSNNFYLCQGGTSEENLTVPKSWMLSKRSQSYIDQVRNQVHGRGMSQNGAWYLALEKGWDYTKILDYFYGDEGVTLASINAATSKCTSSNNGSFTPLESYNLRHEGLQVLNRTLNSSEINDLNNYLDNEINKAGFGTGGAVAAAGQGLTYWLEQKGYYLIYYWGGGHGSFGDKNGTFVGANPNWGANYGYAYTSSGRKTGPYLGMDCSGFVSWAIRTACKPSGFNQLAGYFASKVNHIKLSDAKPGDVLDSSTHIQLVVKNNGDGSVIVAEETLGGTGGLVFSLITSTSYSVVDMSGWYSNNCDYVAPGSGSGSDNSSSSSSFDTLKTSIQNYVNNSGVTGNYSVYVKNLKNGSVMNINGDKKIVAASEIKLFIMAATYDQIYKGNINENDVYNDIKIMIQNSDNNATNRLIDKVGMSTINTYIKNNGYSGTVLARKMLASGNENYTTSRDITTLLEKIYNGTLVNSSYSTKMLSFLKNQTRRSKIPAGVPSGVVVANKTGELSNVENDAAIVYSNGGNYVLVVLSDNLSNTSIARQNIVKISSMVYSNINS